MFDTLREIRLTAASLILLILGWIWVGMFVIFGLSRHAPVDSGANAGSMMCLWFGPLALLGSVAGLFFDRHKPPSLLAISVSVITSLVMLGMGA